MSGFAQIDTEFWFAAPDLDVNHAQAPIRFCVVSYEETANVVFEQPANPSFIQQSFHINANDCYVYDVSDIISMVETQPYNTVLNYGFYIHSDTPVSIYYESDNNNSEIYSLKGKNALGTSFVIPTQYTFENYYSSTCSRVEVVAIEDDTEVTFIPSVSIKGGGMPGVPVMVSLNRGQSYAIEAASPEPSAHIRNTRVTSTKPIAVNTSDDSVNLDGHYDLVGDQIVPIELMGTDYIAIWNNNPNEYLYFFPTVDNTNVYLNGNSLPVATLNVGQEYDCRINTPVVYIHSDYPIAVFQMSSSSLNEFGGTVLPQIDCTGSRKTVYKRQSTSNLVVTLIVRTQYTDGFRLNGNANYISASDFTPVPANTDYSYCKKNVTAYVPTNGLMSLENIYPDGYFHLGILTGIIDGTWNYGYFSDYQPYAFAEFQMADTYCSGQDIEFMYFTESVSNLHLILPDGTEAQLPYVLNNAQVEHSGHYSLQGEDCNGVRVLDEIDIIVTDPVETTISLEGCSNIEWNGITFNHSIDSTWLAPAGPNGCDSVFRLILTVWPENEIDMKEVSLCPEQLPYSFYGVDYYEDVEVTVHDTDIHGCDSMVMLLLTVSDYYMPEPVTKYVGYYDTPLYNWYIPEANRTLTYTTEGTHIDTLPTSTCEGIFTLDLHFRHIQHGVGQLFQVRAMQRAALQRVHTHGQRPHAEAEVTRVQQGVVLTFLLRLPTGVDHRLVVGHDQRRQVVRCGDDRRRGAHGQRRLRDLGRRSSRQLEDSLHSRQCQPQPEQRCPQRLLLRKRGRCDIRQQASRISGDYAQGRNLQHQVLCQGSYSNRRLSSSRLRARQGRRHGGFLSLRRLCERSYHRDLGGMHPQLQAHRGDQNLARGDVLQKPRGQRPD